MNKQIILFAIVLALLVVTTIFSQVYADESETEITKTISGAWTSEGNELIHIIQIDSRFNVRSCSYERKNVKSKKRALAKCAESPRNATMGYWSNESIWIKIGRYRFDYNIVGENLVEVEKSGLKRVFKKENKSS